MKSDYDWACSEVRRALRQGGMFGVPLAKLRKRILKRLREKPLNVHSLDLIRREDGTLHATASLALNGATHTLVVWHNPANLQKAS